MAEARPEEEEDRMRDNNLRTRSSSSGEQPNRRKPEHRLSQGPLSSIRAAIKRTSNRATPLSEPSRDPERRRPQITVVSAEPLAATSWFSGSGGFPPPPPPPAQVWGSSIPPFVQPPPSYDQVIREKSQELRPPPAPSSSSSSSSSPSSSSSLASRPVSTTTIATQTDTESSFECSEAQTQRPSRPPRPALPLPLTWSHDDPATTSESARDTLDGPTAQLGTTNQGCDLLGSPLTFDSAAQTDQSARLRPRPRPRSDLRTKPLASEVKVQTLVKLREDGFATLASRRAADGAESRGSYLQELLDAFGSDDWGFPACHGDDRAPSQSESEEDDAPEEMQSSEPRPRPRLQGQPDKPRPPIIAPKPQHVSFGRTTSSGEICEGGGASSAEPIAAQETSSEGSSDGRSTDGTSPKDSELTSAPGPDRVAPPRRRTTEKPAVMPKPQTRTSAPVPAPRPVLHRALSSTSDASTTLKAPPRPSAAPRTSTGGANQNQDSTDKPTAPTPLQRHCVDAGGGALTGSEEPENLHVKVDRCRPDVPNCEMSLNAPRRASAGGAPAGGAPPGGAPPGGAPAGGAPAVTQPPAPPPVPGKAPTAASRRSSAGSIDGTRESCSDRPRPRRSSNVKHLPLRPPPIKSAPGRPPPPTVSSANQTPPSSKPGPARSVPASNQVSSRQSPRTPRIGPPLPPRPKPGHPLYVKQEVLIVLDDSSPAPSGEDSTVTLINQSECLLDVQPEPALDQESQSKPTLEKLSQSDQQTILPVEQKRPPEAPPLSCAQCVAVFDFEGKEEDELTFTNGDVIALLGLVDRDWGRGLIQGREGIFPLSFTEALEPLPPSQGEPTPSTGNTVSLTSATPVPEEWAVAVFDFPAQSAEDVGFQRGSLILVTEHVDPQWRRGRVDGREGLYPASFTAPCSAPCSAPCTALSAKARFDFRAESDDELTLKVGDVITEVEPVDEQWVLGVVGGRRGIVPKNYISLL